MSRSRTPNSDGTRRREFLALGVGAFVVAALPAALRHRNRLFRRTLPVMGTLAELAVVTSDSRQANVALDAACAELLRVDRTMSRFLSTSDVGRANDADGAVAVRFETATVLLESLRWAEATDGAFDPCVGRVMDLWDLEHRTSPPATGPVQRLAGRHLHRCLDVDLHGGRAYVRLSNVDAAIDLGGIAKGWGVDRATEALRERGIEGAIVNVGGDLRTLGTDVDGTAWRIGVRSPRDPSTLSRVVDLRDRAIATSGDYERGFDHGERRYHHLMDPATGAPRDSTPHAVTITADTCMTADAAATAIFGAKSGEARALLDRVAQDARIEEVA